MHLSLSWGLYRFLVHKKDEEITGYVYANYYIGIFINKLTMQFQLIANNLPNLTTNVNTWYLRQFRFLCIACYPPYLHLIIHLNILVDSGFL